MRAIRPAHARIALCAAAMTFLGAGCSQGDKAPSTTASAASAPGPQSAGASTTTTAAATSAAPSTTAVIDGKAQHDAMIQKQTEYWRTHGYPQKSASGKKAQTKPAEKSKSKQP